MIVGIDLGTTNSLIGAYLDDRPTLFPNAFGDFLTPSAVSLDDKGEVIVGRAAKDRLLTHPDRSVATFKRWMGSSRETVLGARRLRPEELSALVLKSLLADAEAATGRRPTEAVISVPAYFSDAQRNATRTAGELAGVKVERLINEPTAAALAYGLHDRDREARFLVFDLGGGTLDVSVVEIFEGVVEVHASAGDNFLGGEDFVDLLAKSAAGDLGFDPAELKPSDRAQFLRRMERLKIELSKAQRATAEFAIDGKALSWAIEEGRFASLAEPLIQRLRAPLERTLRDANLSPTDLDEVILVGGATRMPLVARLVARTLGRLPLRHVDPDHAIAQGAAVASGMKARNAKLEEIILTDVCPYTLGVDTTKFDSSNAMHSGYFLPIINRSSSVPVSREEELWPVHDEQTVMMINVYQGEHPLAEKNVKLGSLKIPLPPGDDNSKRSVVVRFTYDINGILQVEVVVKATGERHELILEQNPGVLDKAEIQQRLAALAELKLHPRENHENVALLARAERLYEEQLSDREHLQHMVLEFRSVLESQDPRRISRARSEFAEALNMIERV